MIATWLDQDFRQLFERNPQVRVVLWFDDRGDFERLLDEGTFPPDDTAYRLLRYDADAGHGQLWLKAQIVWETRDLPEDERDAMRWVLYLPFERDATEVLTGEPGSLEYLLEYRYRGREWLVGGKKPTLFAFLRDHGVPLPDSPREQRKLWEGGRDSLLAKYAAKFWDRDERFWSESLTAEKVQQRIIGDLEDHLFEVLADPEHAVDYLAEEDLLDEFKREVATQFGVDDDIEVDPRGWVEDFTIRLALTECYVGFGEPEDFPFEARVADRKHRDQCLSFLDTWLSHRDFAQVYQELIRGLEASFDLSNWAESHEGHCEALLHLAEMEWLAFYRELGEVTQSRARSAEFLEQNEERIDREADGYWAEDARVLNGWAIARDTLTVIREATQAENEADDLSEAGDFVRAYAERWHRADRAYWEVFAAVRAGGDFEHLQAVADLHYAHYLDATSMAFQQALRDKEELPSPTVLESNVALWDQPGRQAVIMVDALRFDLAATLLEEIGDADADLEAWVAAVPPITSVGMTALLATDASEVRVEVSDGKLQLVHEQFGDLSLKPNRVALTAERFNARAMELDELLSPGSPDTEEEACLVIFTRDIDSAGHEIASDLPSLFNPLLHNLWASIAKLQRSGYETIHLVSDHGFLLVSGGDEFEDVPSNLCRQRRHVILAEGAPTDLLTMRVAMSDDLWVAFAPGVCSFGTPQHYMHGGASLQELVVPHLMVRTEQVAKKVQVDVTPTTTEIATLTLRVKLVVESIPDSLFDTPQARTVEVYVTRDDEVVSNTIEETIGVGDAGELPVTLFLDDEAGLRKGDVLRLRARDTETDEELIEDITLDVMRDF